MSSHGEYEMEQLQIGQESEQGKTVRINDILDKASEFLSSTDQALIQKAYVFSAAKHSGQVRLSGEPYLSHPLEVADYLAQMRLDASTIASGLLHDTMEDTDVGKEELKEHFGEEVAEIVDGVTKIGQVTFNSKEEAKAENIRKMILAMARDIRVILVKLADRLHNVSTLGAQGVTKRRLIAQETLDIYSPIAHRLGLYWIKVELDDLSLKHLKPDIYNRIEKGIQEDRTLGQDYVDQVTGALQDLMDSNSITGRVSGRQKHIYSIYHKMQRQNLDLSQVYDLIAFRVIVESIRDCYAMLGLIHSMWQPVPGRFKDYISMPKANLYQSLHTTVVGPEGEHIEIQIRTEEMHRIAEHGVAAHWKYKDGTTIVPKDEDRFSWIRRILDWEHEMKDPREFMASLKVDLFQDEVYVFTPKGEVLELPVGATPVDFAYQIHTEVGDRCSGGKVNGKLVALDTQLSNGDTVEIITSTHHRPSRDWLKFVKTAKARGKIRHWIRTEEREYSISLAKEMLEKEGRRLDLNFTRELNSGSLDKVAEEFSYKCVEDMLSAVGYAKLTPKQVLHRLLPREKRGEKAREKPEDADVSGGEKKGKETKESKETKKKGGKKHLEDGIRVKGADDVLIRFAKCCQPVPGDPIVGYISQGRGVVVHTTDCSNVQKSPTSRLLDVSWAAEEQKEVFPAATKLICRNKKGVLGEVSNLLLKEGINIQSGHFQTDIEGKTELILNLEVSDSTHLYQALQKLSSLENVYEAVRTSGEKA
ncbi:MAG: bifunctional (p)ppGpp synthetase/guanosine-3',5'-bis(diphosphate) 3'-pyrophosphohydrolase, partial [Desulfohalobiaceae bacterium]